MPADPLAIARDLIRCRSITPEEGGALGYLQTLLGRAGFEVYRAVFAEPGTAPIDNLYARIGTARPNLLFAGHTGHIYVAQTRRTWGAVRPAR